MWLVEINKQAANKKQEANKQATIGRIMRLVETNKQQQ
jgi:hypothetical protein